MGIVGLALAYMADNFGARFLHDVARFVDRGKNGHDLGHIGPPGGVAIDEGSVILALCLTGVGSG